MTDKERLVKLLGEHCSVGYETNDCTNPFTDDCAECLADYILDDGWIRPPCKTGEVVWINTKFGTLKARVTEITQTINNKFLVHIIYDLMYCFKQHINTQGYVGYLEDKFEFGKTAYHTKEEAEKALRDGESDA